MAEKVPVLDPIPQEYEDFLPAGGPGGFDCPNCGASSFHKDDKHLASGPIMTEADNPGLSWWEFHQCGACETKYKFINGC